MKIEAQILEILREFEAFKLTTDEQGVRSKSIAYTSYVERIKALITSHPELQIGLLVDFQNFLTEYGQLKIGLNEAQRNAEIYLSHN